MSALRDALRELPEAVFADVLESEDAYLVILDLPGTTSETVELRGERNCLHVEATRKKSVPEGFNSVVEARAEELTIELPLPMDANGHESTASMDRGVLEITVPKATDAAETTIPVDG